MPRRLKFTPQLFAEIQRRVAVGQPAREIADRLGCDYGSMRVMCHRYCVSLRVPGKRGGRTMDPFRTPPKSLELKLPTEVHARLRIEAGKRGVTTRELETTILDAVLSDDLIAAVLG